MKWRRCWAFRLRTVNLPNLAFSADHTIDLGTRCAAFMGQAVPSAQREGVSMEVITASLANSIAKNYLSKVVGTRKLGKKIILTGAVFYNKAVVSAFNQQLPGKEPAGSRTPGGQRRYRRCSAGERIYDRRRNPNLRAFRRSSTADCNLSTFTCKGCDNNCSITQMKVPGEKPTFYGSRCDKYDSTLESGRKGRPSSMNAKSCFSGNIKKMRASVLK